MQTDLTTSNARQTNSSVSEKVRAVMILIQQQWPHAQIDMRDPANVWADAIDPLSIAQILYAKSLLKNVTDKFPINAAQFRGLALRHRSETVRPESIADNSEYGAMKRAASSAYAMRVCGRKPSFEGTYHGSFDYMHVVNAVPVPAQDEVGHAAHKPYWDGFFNTLKEEWTA